MRRLTCKDKKKKEKTEREFFRVPVKKKPKKKTKKNPQTFLFINWPESSLDRCIAFTSCFFLLKIFFLDFRCIVYDKKLIP